MCIKINNKISVFMFFIVHQCLFVFCKNIYVFTILTCTVCGTNLLLYSLRYFCYLNIALHQMIPLKLWHVG